MGAVLRNTAFLRLWVAQLLSQTANNIVNFALLMRVQDIIRIHEVEQGNTATSLVILAFSLPAVLFGPIAGVIADRFNRKHVMFATNMLRVLAMALFLSIPVGLAIQNIERWVEKYPRIFLMFPGWYWNLITTTSRDEQRRLAYMWLRLPTRTQWLYNTHDALFFQWTDLVLLSMV